MNDNSPALQRELVQCCFCTRECFEFQLTVELQRFTASPKLHVADSNIESMSRSRINKPVQLAIHRLKLRLKSERLA